MLTNRQTYRHTYILTLTLTHQHTCAYARAHRQTITPKRCCAGVKIFEPNNLHHASQFVFRRDRQMRQNARLLAEDNDTSLMLSSSLFEKFLYLNQSILVCTKPMCNPSDDDNDHPVWRPSGMLSKLLRQAPKHHGWSLSSSLGLHTGFVHTRIDWLR